ncbi:hypothetical protein Mal15_13180 [Stieleria maiorica]|uniref:Uncharacterized protein n=1 Tax=Stieleria maiorica TaxID=2795974 RepID=A0A5B9M9R7_9BACT|nr:hypothetical protein Mal15_13180 [Stieleria maiorica]
MRDGVGQHFQRVATNQRKDILVTVYSGGTVEIATIDDD